MCFSHIQTYMLMYILLMDGLCVLPTGPELGNGHMGGLLTQRKLKGDALAQQSVTEGLVRSLDDGMHSE